jgi:hypothetical protein
MNKKFYNLSLLLIVFSVTSSCGGGGTAAAASSSSSSAAITEITGLQGDMNAIEPIDLD